jgi:hypothetical protein
MFPSLGGQWEGFVEFPGIGERRSVTLTIKHALFELRILLESEESSSSTLVAHAERDPDFDRFRLYYVYRNEPKIGTVRLREAYWGVAIVSVDASLRPITLVGEYLTDSHRKGVLRAQLKAPNPRWQLTR